MKNGLVLHHRTQLTQVLFSDVLRSEQTLLASSEARQVSH